MTKPLSKQLFYATWTLTWVTENQNMFRLFNPLPEQLHGCHAPLGPALYEPVRTIWGVLDSRT
jgi:hypothetical protein